jgi:putative FmdB family regulatory protein
LPIYEYECEDCKKNFEVFLGIKDEPVKECIHCEGTSIRKLISNCSFQLKGTGWYVTDYARKENNGEANGKENKKQPDTQKTTETKAEKKDTVKKNPEKKDSGKAA